MWKELQELNEIFTPMKERVIVDDADVVRFRRIRLAKEHFNKVIDKYLKENGKSISEISKRDVNLLGKSYTIQDREILIQQIMYRLETNYGKPLKWIRENNKSALFKEIESNGWTNSGSEVIDNWAGETWVISTTKETSWWNSWWDWETDNSSSE